MTNQGLAAIEKAVAGGKTDAAGLVTQALKEGVTAEDIVSKAIELGLENLEGRFRRSEAYMPDVLLAKRSVKGCMVALGDKATVELDDKIRQHFEKMQSSCKSCHPVKLWDS